MSFARAELRFAPAEQRSLELEQSSRGETYVLSHV